MQMHLDTCWPGFIEVFNLLGGRSISTDQRVFMVRSCQLGELLSESVVKSFSSPRQLVAHNRICRCQHPTRVESKFTVKETLCTDTLCLLHSMLPNLKGYFILSFCQGRELGVARLRHKCHPTEALMEGTRVKEDWRKITTTGAAKYSQIKGHKPFQIREVAWQVDKKQIRGVNGGRVVLAQLVLARPGARKIAAKKAMFDAWLVHLGGGQIWNGGQVTLLF